MNLRSRTLNWRRNERARRRHPAEAGQLTVRSARAARARKCEREETATQPIPKSEPESEKIDRPELER